MHTFVDFFVETYGVWKKCDQPNRTPDFKSEKKGSSSKYWDCGDYVVRKSNHWGIVGSCFWKIDSLPRWGILNLPADECAMIYYKDFGTSRQKSIKKIPPRKKFMAIQPDIHHEGPITIEVVSGLVEKLKTALTEIREFQPEKIPDLDQSIVSEWIYCQSNWIETIEYAGLRCEKYSPKNSTR